VLVNYNKNYITRHWVCYEFFSTCLYLPNYTRLLHATRPKPWTSRPRATRAHCGWDKLDQHIINKVVGKWRNSAKRDFEHVRMQEDRLNIRY